MISCNGKISASTQGQFKKIFFNRRVRKGGAKIAKSKQCLSNLCDLGVKT